MKVPAWLAKKRRPEDPAERWELPYSMRDGSFFFRNNYAGHPYVPRSSDEVPAGALECLETACGVEDLGQVLIIPPSVRATGLGNHKVITPLHVMAVGARAIGLWAAKPEPGAKVIIGLDRLAAIEDVQILLYGRLSFLSRDQRLTVRYNTVCRRVLEPPLQRLRKRVCGPACHPVQPRGQYPVLPFKWNFLLSWPFTTLDPLAPRDFSFHPEPLKKKDWMGKGHMLILTPWELVSMREPPDSCHSYGVDTFFVPRSRIEAIEIRQKSAQVTANGARFELLLSPALLTGISAWFARAPAAASA